MRRVRTSWNKGIPCSKETRKKISLSLKGRNVSNETKRKLSTAWKKNPLCQENIRKMILGNIGRNHSGETKMKISLANRGVKNFLGKKHTKETKRRISLAHRNKKLSEETKRKLSLLYKGKTWEEIYGEEKAKEIKIKTSLSHSGKNNPSWLGGKSFEPYTIDFNNRFKKLIRKRDIRTCQLCNLFEDDCLELYKQKLSIHHIDYNKLNSFPQNCVSLCMKCNSLVNKNREHWKLFFQSLLKEKYKYEYTQNQKIILDFVNGGL